MSQLQPPLDPVIALGDELVKRRVVVVPARTNDADYRPVAGNQSITLTDAEAAATAPIYAPPTAALAADDQVYELSSALEKNKNGPITIAQRNAFNAAPADARPALRPLFSNQNLITFNGIATRAAAISAAEPAVGPPLAARINAAVGAQAVAAATIDTESEGAATTWFMSRTFFNRYYGEDRTYGAMRAQATTDVLQELMEEADHLPLLNRHTLVIAQVIAGSFLLSQALHTQIVDYLRNVLLSRRPTWKIGLQCRFAVIHAGIADVLEKTVVSPSIGLVSRGSDLSEKVDEMIKMLWSIIGERDFGKSGFQLLSVRSVQIDAARHSPIAAGEWISTPPYLEKKGVLNVRNFDNFCAKYAFSLAVMIHENDERKTPAHYERPSIYANVAARFNWEGIEFPMEVSSWSKFERQNPGYMVFVYEPQLDSKGNFKSMEIARLPDKRTTDAVPIYLVLIEKELEDGSVRHHYLTVNSLGRLLNTRQQQLLCCPYCLCQLDEKQYDAHMKDCAEICESKCILPPPGTYKEFSNFQNKFPQPIRIFADFECRMLDATVPSSDGAERVRTHVPTSFAILVDNSYAGKTDQPLLCPVVLYKHSNPQQVVDKFIETLKDYSDKIKAYLSKTVENRHHRCDEETMLHTAFPLIDKCAVCDELLCNAPPSMIRMNMMSSSKKRTKKHSGKDVVEDEAVEGSHDEPCTSEPEHSDDDSDGNPFDDTQECIDLLMSLHEDEPAQAAQSRTCDFGHVSMINHHTGEFMGFAHSICQDFFNRATKRSRVPCFFHNATGYDMKIILKYLGGVENFDDLEQVFCIAQSSERFKRIDITDTVSIVDSMSHMNASLDKLVTRVTNNGRNPEKCQLIRSNVLEKFGAGAPWEMLTRKGVFPYGWLDSYDKLSSTVLPPKEAFISDLNGQGITDDEYRYAQLVWDVFGCKTFEDYHDIYLLVDVCALADIIRSYIAFSVANYGLDPTHYASSPAFAQDAMLKLTRVRLELISDVNIYLAFERAVRGGVSAALLPHATVTNKYLRYADGDQSMEEKAGDAFLVVWDENNMYGGSMCEYLPVGGFQWLSDHEVAHFQLDTLPKASCAQGQLLEVDLEFPPELHDFFNSFPPAPEKVMVQDEWLSEWQNEAFKMKKTAKTAKLVPHLLPHHRYMVHGHTLRTYMDLGVRVTKIHRILVFEQAQVIKPFVELNTRLRIAADAAGDEFGVDEAKKNTNSIYGKTLEDKRNYGTYRLVSTRESEKPERQKHFRRLLGKNTLKHMFPMGSLWVLQYAKKTVKLDQPVYLGSAILDLSKRSIYNFWFNVVLKNFPGAKLAYTDTDSAVCVVPSGDIFRDCSELEKRHNGGRPIENPGEGFFDWSSFAPTSPYFSRVNAKILRKFKFDMGSKIPRSIICLRSKMYSICDIWDHDKKKFLDDKRTAKGVPRDCRKDLDYRACISDGQVSYVEFVKISGRKFDLRTEKQRKEGLAPACFNDKRFIVKNEDGTLTALSIGHVRLANMQ